MEEKQTAQGTTAPAPPVPKPDVDDLIFTGQIGYISDRQAPGGFSVAGTEIFSFTTALWFYIIYHTNLRPFGTESKDETYAAIR